MTSILQTARSALQNEIIFNSHCREMAKDNLSLAGSYITSVFARSVTTSATSLTLKGRCMNLMKASLLLPRAFLLCLPLTNRMTQLGLRFLSPKPSIACINSFSSEELSIRYNQDRVIELKFTKLKSDVQDKIPTKENITAACKECRIYNEDEIREIHKSLVIPYIQNQLESQKSKKIPTLKLSCFTKLGLSANEEIQPIIQALKNIGLSFEEHKSLFFHSLKSA